MEIAKAEQVVILVRIKHCTNSIKKCKEKLNNLHYIAVKQSLTNSMKHIL